MRILSLFIVLFGVSIKAQSHEAKEICEFVLEMYEEVFSDFNIERMDTYFADDVTFFYNGIVHTKQSMGEHLVELKSQFESEENKNHDFKIENTIDFMNVEFKVDYAWVSFQKLANYTMNNQLISKIQWLESIIMIKKNGKWKVQLMHSTIVK